MSHQIEVEIKTLLGSFEAAESLLRKLKQNDKNFTLKSKSKQLNHYFIDGKLSLLSDKVSSLLNEESKFTLKHLIDNVKNYSVRTRKTDDIVLLIVKTTVDDTTSENGTARIEFEVPVNTSIEELDQYILDAGFKYQAKWSRERQEYAYKNYSVSIDKNAGYGYLAEFERILSPEENFELVKGEIRDELQQLGLQELEQERLQRMFEFYNNNWSDYYGTDKTFTIL
jgi:predicted adenylyl cyclase CyaB